MLIFFSTRNQCQGNMPDMFEILPEILSNRIEICRRSEFNVLFFSTRNQCQCSKYYEKSCQIASKFVVDQNSMLFFQLGTNANVRNITRNLVKSHRNLSSIRIQCWFFFQRGTNAKEMIFPRSPLFHHRLCSSSNDNTHWLCKHAKHRESKLPKLWSLIKKIWFFSLWC